MTVLDDKLVPKARELIAKYGLTATAKQYESRTYDPETGMGAAGAESECIVSPPFPYSEFYVDQDLVQSGDSITFMAAQNAPFIPKVGMLLIIGTEEWRVVDVAAIRTGELIALWSLQMRK